MSMYRIIWAWDTHFLLSHFPQFLILISSLKPLLAALWCLGGAGTVAQLPEPHRACKYQFFPEPCGVCSSTSPHYVSLRKRRSAFVLWKVSKTSDLPYKWVHNNLNRRNQLRKMVESMKIISENYIPVSFSQLHSRINLIKAECCRAWWYMRVIPALGEAEAEGSWVEEKPGLHYETLSQWQNSEFKFLALVRYLNCFCIHLFNIFKKQNSPIKSQTDHRLKTHNTLFRKTGHLKKSKYRCADSSSFCLCFHFRNAHRLYSGRSFTMGTHSQKMATGLWPAHSKEDSPDTSWRHTEPSFDTSVNHAIKVFVSWIPQWLITRTFTISLSEGNSWGKYVIYNVR